MISPATNPLVRIYVPTYRRHSMLRRALESISRQSFGNWIAEIHNDDPEDLEPGKIVASFEDPRFHYVHHPSNLGGPATFNLFYRSIEEPFYAMLEDDNWWDPHFLSIMLETAKAFPDCTVFWSNMRIWQETTDGSFLDTGHTARQVLTSDSIRKIEWGQTEQIMGAIHSHSATFFRSRQGDHFEIPAVPIAVVEMFRERLFPYPLVFIPQVLAHFSLTQKTARSQDPGEWAELQTMLAATFLKQAGYDKKELDLLWKKARRSSPPATTTLLWAGLSENGCRYLLAHARIKDWLLLFRGALRRPWVAWRILRSKKLHPDWWAWLDRCTRMQFQNKLPA